MNYVAGFVLSFVLSLVLVPPVRKIAIRIGAIDQPVPNSRKIHTKPIPRAGGLALALSFFVTILLINRVWSMEVAGLLLGLVMMLGLGLLDDIYNLNPWVKLGGQILAALVVMLFGVRIMTLSHLSGGYIVLDQSTGSITLAGVGLSVSVVSIGLSLLWLVGMTNTMNFLDGLDGLSCGVAAIASIVMFALAVSPDVNQPTAALLSIVLAGACLGYLPYNFYPAKIFNGDSGAYFLGFALGGLAILSGAKLATAMLVLGLPILDAVWAVLRRLATGRSPFSADRGHIHHLLLDIGMTQTQAVLVIYSFSICFGIVALLSQTRAKIIAFAVLVGITSLLLGFLHIRHAYAQGKKS